MTGKEAFKKIMEKYGETNTLEGTYDYFLAIKKDLEVLEILKNKLEIKSLDIGIEDIFLKGTEYIVMFEEEKDFDKVKGWLDDGKINNN